MPPESHYYIKRTADKIAKDEQTQTRGYTLTIKGPRQTGKSSLLGKIMADAYRQSKPIAFLDFQTFGHVDAMSPDDLFRQFAFLIEISSEPAMLIDDLTQSPFNVGAVIELEDFSLPEIGKMNAAHGKPVNEQQASQLFDLLSGHPYLSRRALYGLCQGRYTFDAMMAEAESESGPFGDHLRALLTRIGLRPDLLSHLKTVLQTGRCDDRERHRLISGGLIVDKAGRLHARNKLYDRYFRRVLLG